MMLFASDMSIQWGLEPYRAQGQLSKPVPLFFLGGGVLSLFFLKSIMKMSKHYSLFHTSSVIKIDAHPAGLYPLTPSLARPVSIPHRPVF